MIATLILLLTLLQSPADLFKSANADMDAGKFGDAALKFEQILHDDPTHIPSEFSLAVCYTKVGKPELAQDLYSKIVEQDPEIYEARFNLAVLLHESGDDGAADAQFLKAAEMHPHDARPLIFHAQFLEKQGDVEKALEFYERAAAADPSDTDAQRAAVEVRVRLGSEYRRAGQLDKAIEVLRPLGPYNSEIALAYYAKKNYGKAADVFQVLLRTDSNNPDYLYLLGKCLMELKQYTPAAATFLQVLKAKPNDLEAISSLASTYQLQEDWARAAATIERFVQLKPRDAYAYFMLATSYDRLENVRLALLNYNRFLELDDKSNDARSFQARERAKTLERRLKNPQ